MTEVLQSIKASEMTPMLQRIYQAEGGNDALYVLMKYLLVTLPHVPTLYETIPTSLRSWEAGKYILRIHPAADTKEWPPLETHQRTARASHHRALVSRKWAADRERQMRAVERR